MERARQWAIRCMHEAQQHGLNSFITLTYGKEHLPENGVLVRPHVSAFIKRYRAWLQYEDRDSERKRLIQYFGCGEYGDRGQRPHYHLLIFGHDMPDKRPWKKTRDGQLYVSAKLEELWGMGFCTTGPVTYKTAGYCARYALKKINGQMAEKHYERVNPETGEIYRLPPEFGCMSLKRPIGKSWYGLFKEDLYPDDFAVTGDGGKAKVPVYYDRQLKREDPQLHLEVKDRRTERARDPKLLKDQTRRRLSDRETVKKAALALYAREPEE